MAKRNVTEPFEDTTVTEPAVDAPAAKTGAGKVERPEISAVRAAFKAVVDSGAWDRARAFQPEMCSAFSAALQNLLRQG